MRPSLAAQLALFPDLQIRVEDLIAEGDKVVTRYTVRMPPSVVTTGIWIDRIEGNQVVESWVDWVYYFYLEPWDKESKLLI